MGAIHPINPRYFAVSWIDLLRHLTPLARSQSQRMIGPLRQCPPRHWALRTRKRHLTLNLAALPRFPWIWAPLSTIIIDQVGTWWLKIGFCPITACLCPETSGLIPNEYDTPYFSNEPTLTLSQLHTLHDGQSLHSVILSWCNSTLVLPRPRNHFSLCTMLSYNNSFQAPRPLKVLSDNFLLSPKIRKFTPSK